MDARWLQAIGKGVKDLELPSPDKAGSPKKSKKKKTLAKQRERNIYTVVNADEVDSILGSFQQLDIGPDCHVPLKSSKGMERALEPFPVGSSDKLEQLFVHEDDAIGLPTKSENRWNQLNNRTVYSDMRFIAVLPAQASHKPDETDSEPGERVEHTLCKIQYFGNGNFSISPNFTREDRHQFQIGNDCYEYTVTNVSSKLSEENEKKEQQIFEEFFKRQHLIREERLSAVAFEGLPFAFTQRYCINGEIVSCQGFHSDVLYCQYLVHLPSEWRSDAGHTNLLSASTQVSYSSYLDGHLDRTSFFGFPLEINVLCGAESPPMPAIYLKVMSIDGEDRHCVEGYGHAVIPREPGTTELEITTWRPQFHFSGQIRAWFLGGSPELADLKFNELEDIRNPLNRYGFQTETSGKILLRFNTLMQKECPELKLGANKYAFIGTRNNRLGKPDKALQETNYALERARIRLATLKTMDSAVSPAHS
ncbi:Pleiotropic negative transcriptional regulator [Kappamyces sp. JEL0829]|nr:Pleiotropic negative transcriptional regulator [Kappamyces sp. JEL0829]